MAREVGKEIVCSTSHNNPKYKLALTVLQNFAADPAPISPAAVHMLRHAHFDAIEGAHLSVSTDMRSSGLWGFATADQYDKVLIECHRIAIVTAYTWRSLEPLCAPPNPSPTAGPPRVDWSVGKRAAQVNLMTLLSDLSARR